MAKIITAEEFEIEVIQSDVPVMVDFFAPWCMPCKMLEPLIEEVAAEFNGRAKVVKLNIDEAPALVAQCGIRAVPTLMFFKDGAAVDMVTGMMSGDAMAEKFNTLV